MTDKKLLKDTLLGLEAEQLNIAERHYHEYLHGAEANASETSTLDDISQRVADGELAQSFEAPIHTHQQALAVLQTLDFGPKTEVGPGAVVKLGGRNFVVAVATMPFQCDGQSYMGISIQAPIYQAMQGKEAGESFTFNGRKQTIEAVC